jgi:hypothetical protein
LADVLVENVHRVVGAVEQPRETAAGTNRAELAVVADQHHLRPCRLRRDQDPQDVAIAGHTDLVDDHHGGGVEGLAAVVEAPQQRSDRAALDAGLPAQRAGRLPRRRRPDHPVPGALVSVADTGQGGRLARTRYPNNQLHSPAGGGDRPHRVGLAVGERPAQLGFLAGDDRLHRGCRDSGGTGGVDAAEEHRGDRGLDGDDRRRGVDLLAGARDPDERDDLGVPEQDIDRPDQLRRVTSEDPRTDRDDHVSAGEHLPSSETAVGSEHVVAQLPKLVEGQRREQLRA